mmetsp:Transcript_121529/g.223858  ORF Transcript_121529/g.223858 Transcript_121529/m.223858 type:complete len:333 (+) Transcript_121529:59-1057(+)
MAQVLSLEEWNAMFDEHIEQYSDPKFQMKLHARWHATTDKGQQAKMQQQVCLEIQKPIISKFGFEASKKGLTQVSASFIKSEGLYDEVVLSKWALMNWLVDPDIQAAEPKGPSGRWTTQKMKIKQTDEVSNSHDKRRDCAYRIIATDIKDGSVIKGVDICRATLVGAHHILYTDAYPCLQPETWLRFLGCEKSITDALESGTIVLHAERTDTNQVVGYVSCDRVCGDSRLGRRDDDSEVQASGESFCKINHIVVLPEHRRRGLANKMFKTLVDFLQGTSPTCASEFRLNVLQLNQDAIAWYKRLGFHVKEVRNVLVAGCPVKLISMRCCLEK